MTDSRILVLIPARMAATRLPGKPLLDIAGLPMIVHVLRRAEEVAKEMRMSREDFFRMLDQVRGAVLVSLDEARSGDEQEPSTLAEHLPDPAAINLEEKLAEEEDKLLLLRTLDHLPEQERLVVALYYYEQMTLKEIGRALGISESRVSQVHTRAMARLRVRLASAAAEAA